jgi:hypothetical protein
MTTPSTIAVPLLKCLLKHLRRQRFSPLALTSFSALTTAYTASAALAALGGVEEGRRRSRLRSPIDYAIAEGRACGRAIADAAGERPDHPPSKPPKKLVLAAPLTDKPKACSLLGS